MKKDPIDPPKVTSGKYATYFAHPVCCDICDRTVYEQDVTRFSHSRKEEKWSRRHLIWIISQW
jgi:hypothetical protein